MLNDFEIKKIKKLTDRSREQDEKLFKLRKKLARIEKSILGYDLSGDDNGKER